MFIRRSRIVQYYEELSISSLFRLFLQRPWEARYHSTSCYSKLARGSGANKDRVSSDPSRAFKRSVDALRKEHNVSFTQEFKKFKQAIATYRKSSLYTNPRSEADLSFNDIIDQADLLESDVVKYQIQQGRFSQYQKRIDLTLEQYVDASNRVFQMNEKSPGLALTATSTTDDATSLETPSPDTKVDKDTPQPSDDQPKKNSPAAKGVGSKTNKKTEADLERDKLQVKEDGEPRQGTR